MGLEVGRGSAWCGWGDGEVGREGMGWELAGRGGEGRARERRGIEGKGAEDVGGEAVVYR